MSVLLESLDRLPVETRELYFQIRGAYVERLEVCKGVRPPVDLYVTTVEELLHCEERANTVAALEEIVAVGLAEITPQISGKLWITPQLL